MTALGQSNLWVVVTLIFVVNLPFGFWRAGLRKFTLPWFVAVHAPVPLAIGLRLLFGLGWRLRTLPLFVAAFFAGQFLGGKLRARRDKRRARRGTNGGAR